MTSACNKCGIKKKLIDGKYCEPHTLDEMIDCKEDFTVTYKKEIKKDDATMVYEYEYPDNRIMKPLYYIGDQAYAFQNINTGEKFYFDQETKQLVSYDSDKRRVPMSECASFMYKMDDFPEPTPSQTSLVNKIESHINSDNEIDEEDIEDNISNNVVDVPESTSNKITTTTTTTTTTQVPKPQNIVDVISNIVKKQKINPVDIKKQEMEEEEQEEQEEEQPHSNNKVQTILKNTGFTKGFILSLIYELGSKDLKIKLIEDDREQLEDEDLKKLKELAAEDNIIIEEEDEEYREKEIIETSPKNIVKPRKIQYIPITEYSMPVYQQILLVIICFLVISGIGYVIISKDLL